MKKFFSILLAALLTLSLCATAFAADITINSNTNVPGLDVDGKTFNAYKVLDLVNRYHMHDRVILSSFNHETLLRCKALDPTVPCGALTESWIVSFEHYLQNLGLECAHPEHWYLTDQNIASLKEKGLRIHTWTVNDPAVMARLIEKEVDILITNHPDVLAKMLKR